MWQLLALFGAVFTALTTILAKIGIKNTNSNFATAYRTFVVIICSVIVCAISGSIVKIPTLTWQNYLFLVLSGIMTGCSWLCYFRALKLGNVNKVAPIDKSSYVLSCVLFLIFFFNDTTNNGSPLSIVFIVSSIALVGVGVLLMITPGKQEEVTSKTWLIFAILSAVFAALVSLFVKIGLKGIPSDLGTLFRTIVVFIFASAIVLARKDYKGAKEIDRKTWLFLSLSGVATGGAWLCEYMALNATNSNPIVVNSISKLAILITMLFSYFILKEKFTLKTWIGLAVLTLGIVLSLFY